jgi:hypothetical protein
MASFAPNHTGSRGFEGTPRGMAVSSAPMPVSYEVDAPRRIVKMRYEHEADLAELVAALSAIFSHPGYQPGFGFLFDRRAVPASSSGYIRAALSWVQLHKEKVTGCRWAVVVADLANYGMSRMGQTLGEDLPVEFEVFRDMDEATRWLLSDRGGPTG